MKAGRRGNYKFKCNGPYSNYFKRGRAMVQRDILAIKQSLRAWGITESFNMYPSKVEKVRRGKVGIGQLGKHWVNN